MSDKRDKAIRALTGLQLVSPQWSGVVETVLQLTDELETEIARLKEENERLASVCCSVCRLAGEACEDRCPLEVPRE